MLNYTYYHGSEKIGLEKFDLRYADKGAPFGPAVYLTKEKLVARCYTGRSGVIYYVKLNGNPAYTINLDEKVCMQSDIAIRAIKKLAKIHYKNEDVMGLNARDAIHRSCFPKYKANSFLRNRGIWMLYGHLSAMEVSGLMDRGIQYAIINPNFSRIFDYIHGDTIHC